MRLFLFFVLTFTFVGGLAEEVPLRLVDTADYGDWAKPAIPFRLFPTPQRGVRYEGPTQSLSLWGDLRLGDAVYTLLLGVNPANEVGLWVDLNRDGHITSEERIPGAPIPGGIQWELELLAEPPLGKPYPYRLLAVWPEGRGYLFLVSQSAAQGRFGNATVVVVDGDLNGVFGTDGDFLGIDVDGDGEIYAAPDGHEHFKIGEPFTLGEKSFLVRQVAADGSLAQVEGTAYIAPKAPLIPGALVPDFSFKSFPGGETISLSSLRGKVVLLDFWATWCEPCMATIPSLKALYDEFHRKGFEIVGVSLDTSEADLAGVVERYGITWPIAFEGKRWDNRIAQLYRVYQIPTTYLLGRDGRIRHRDPEGEELRKALEQLLAEPWAEAEEDLQVSALPAVKVQPEPILEIVPPPEIGLTLGGTVELSIKVTNTSPYLAEEVRVRLLGPPSGVTAEPSPAFDLPGFGERVVTLVIADAGLAEADLPKELAVQADYHYCVGDSCFQMVQEGKTTLVLGEKPGSPGFSAPWWLLLLLAVGVALSWVLWGRGVAIVALVVMGVAAASLSFGILSGQARQAQRIAEVLCTSCVGIEEVRPEAPEVSATARAALAQLSQPVELVVFHAPWCHSCPYAIALAQGFAEANPNIRVELVDVDEDLDRAEAAGVFRSGRLVVPAILNQGTGEVIFGTDDLEARLLKLVLGMG